jgi:hypothetical protein
MDYVHMLFLSGLRGLPSCRRCPDARMDYVYMLIQAGSSEALALTCLFFGRRPGYGLHPYADTCPYFLLFARRTGSWTTFICLLAGNCWAEAARWPAVGPWTTFICQFQSWCGFAGDFAKSFGALLRLSGIFPLRWSGVPALRCMVGGL